MNYSLVFGGVIVSVVGTFLVNSIGLSELCSTEVTAKVTEYLPLVIGGAMSLIGRHRLGGVNAFGVKK
jgi:hypothetical protein